MLCDARLRYEGRLTEDKGKQHHDVHSLEQLDTTERVLPPYRILAIKNALRALSDRAFILQLVHLLEAQRTLC